MVTQLISNYCDLRLITLIWDLKCRDDKQKIFIVSFASCGTTVNDTFANKMYFEYIILEKLLGSVNLTVSNIHTSIHTHNCVHTHKHAKCDYQTIILFLSLPNLFRSLDNT